MSKSDPPTTTNGEPHGDVTLDGAVVSGADRLPGNGADILEGLYARALVGLCAIQLGVTERALRMAASYTTEREQFGRPIGSFQAVQQRMADAFIDVEAIRWTMWQAAWLLDAGPARPAARPASPNSGRPKQVRESRRPPSRCTAESASTPPIPCSVTSCGPSTTS